MRRSAFVTLQVAASPSGFSKSHHIKREQKGHSQRTNALKDNKRAAGMGKLVSLSKALSPLELRVPKPGKYSETIRCCCCWIQSVCVWCGRRGRLNWLVRAAVRPYLGSRKFDKMLQCLYLATFSTSENKT